MGCKKNAVKFAKSVAEDLTPVVTKAAGRIVLEVEEMAVEDPTFFTNSNKRRIALAKIKATARAEGRQIHETTARVLVEHAVAEGRPPHEAVRWGNAAGALAVTRLGAQSSLPTREEVADLHKRPEANG